MILFLLSTQTLEAELKKLQTIIADTTSNFDDKLLKLFERKLKTEMVIYQVCDLIVGL